jgi:hypothetical protein
MAMGAGDLIFYKLERIILSVACWHLNADYQTEQMLRDLP